MRESEQRWIHTLNSFENGYNVLEFTSAERQKSKIQKWSEENGGFIFVKFLYNNKLFDNIDLTKSDIFKLFYLASFMDYEGYLVYEDTYMKRKDLYLILNKARKNSDLFYNKMKDLGILIQDKYKNTKVNELYFNKGNINKSIKQYNDFTRIYLNIIRFLYKNNDIRFHPQLGSFCKLIPYAHREKNILCSNQNSKKENPTMLDAIYLKDVLGYNRNGIRNLINDLKLITLENGEPIISFYDDNKYHIIINPRAFYGGNFDIRDKF